MYANRRNFLVIKEIGVGEHDVNILNGFNLGLLNVIN